MASSNPSRPPDSADSELVDAAWRQFARSSHGSSPDLQAARLDGDDGQPGLPSDSFPGYEILDTIHRGGQGVVYRAAQESTGRRVAIKVMREGPLSSPSEQARFDREVRILGQLRHPNIVAIHDRGVACGWHYYVMDYIQGRPLGVDDGHGHDSIEHTLALFKFICDAVNAAHLRGIIHRDLKPANILVDADGQPHLLDFGLAKVASTEAAAPLVTMTGQFIGSMPWASPEQCSATPGRIDLRTDVYSLGVILFQMLTGRFPYRVGGDLRTVLDEIQTAEPSRPGVLRREVDDEIDTIVLKCLQKDPERRYQSAGELARDVGHYLAGEPIEAKRDSTGYVVRKHLRRHRVPLAIGAAFVLLLATSSVVAWALYAGAVAARTTATDNMWESYLTQIRSGAASRTVGRRYDSLRAAGEAARIRPTLELRDAATACLALSDIGEVRSFGPSPYAVSRGMRRADRYAFNPEPGTVVIRSIESGEDLARLEAPPSVMYDGAFSPDGRFFGARFHGEGADDDIHVWVWDLESGETRLKFGPGAGAAWYGKLTFGAPAEGPPWVALMHHPREIHTYALPSGTPLRSWSTSGLVKRMVGAPDGRAIATSLWSAPVVQVHDVTSSVPPRVLPVETNVRGLAWSPDGRSVAGGGDDGLVYVWDVETTACVARLAGHSRHVRRVSFDSGGTRLASWSWDRSTRLWDWRSGEQIFAPLQERCLLSFDERLVVTAPSPPPALLTNTRLLGVEVLSIVEPAIPRRISCETRFTHCTMNIADGGRLAVTGGTNGVRLWDMASGTQRAVVTLDRAYSAHLLGDRSVLLVAGTTGLDLVPVTEWADDHVVTGDADRLWSAEGANVANVSPDGRWAALCSRELALLDLERREVVRRWPRFRGMSYAAVSPDGRWVFADTFKGEPARLYDASSGELAREFPGPVVEDTHGAARHVSGRFSPDGAWLVIANGPEYVFLEVGTWQERRRLHRARRYRSPGTTAFRADSAIFAALHDRVQPRLFDVASGRPLITLPNPDGSSITNLAFTDDETLVALTSGHEFLVWDLVLIGRELRDIGLDWRD